MSTRFRAAIFLGTATISLAVAGPASGAIALFLDLDLNQDPKYRIVLHEKVGRKTTRETIHASAITATSEHAGNPASRGDSFTAFSLDVHPDLKTEGYWTPKNLAEVRPLQEGYFAPDRLYRAANLYDAFAEQANSTSKSGLIAGGALQLAIWDVLYGSDVRHVNGRSSNFYVTEKGKYSNQLIAKANYFLRQQANNENPNFSPAFWMATDANGCTYENQDLMGPALSSCFVPEPGTAWCAVAAASYLVFFLRRASLPLLKRRAILRAR